MIANLECIVRRNNGLCIFFMKLQNNEKLRVGILSLKAQLVAGLREYTNDLLFKDTSFPFSSENTNVCIYNEIAIVVYIRTSVFRTVD